MNEFYSIKKTYKDLEIIINTKEDSISLKLKKSQKDVFENNFSFQSLKKLHLFLSNNSIKEIIDSICIYINKEFIKIEEFPGFPKINIIFESNELSKVKTILILEKSNSQFNLKQIENLQLLSFFQTINTNYDNIQFLTSFKSGKMISVSKERVIKIWNENYELSINLYDDLTDPPNVICNLISIKDENIFATCYSDFTLKLWEKTNYKYSIFLKMGKIHKSLINDVIFCSNGNLITCSNDRTIKVWEKINKTKYQCLTVLKHSDFINSILLFENKNTLIGSGTKFWNYNNFECFFYLKDELSIYGSILCKIDEDRIIIGRDKIKVFSISKRKVLKNIENKFNCRAICKIYDKNIVLILDSHNDLRIYSTKDFTQIQLYENIIHKPLLGICCLKNNTFALYSYDGTIYIIDYTLK